MRNAESSTLTPVPSTTPSFWRRPLAVTFVLGCFISAVASGRFTLRLIVDGAVSFAFVPFFDGFALAVVATVARARRPFAAIVDEYFRGYAAWLLWLVVASAVFTIVPPRPAANLVRPALVSALVPLLASQRADFRFFRGFLQRSPHAALRDLMLQRALFWSASIAWFLGIAIWHETIPQLRGWLGR